MKKLMIIFLLIIPLVYAVDFGDPAYEGENMCFPSGEQCGALVEEIAQKCQLEYNYVFPTVKQLQIKPELICRDIPSMRYGCKIYKSPFLAKDYFKIGDYFYANLDDVVKCETFCDPETNRCEGDAQGFVRQCSEGWKQCGLTDTYNPDSDVYECVNGEWELYKDCGNYDCVEAGTTARCKTDVWYCYTGSNLDCFSSSNNFNGDCFETLEQCQNNKPYWCLTDAGHRCVKRLGSCLPGEQAFRATGVDQGYTACAQNMKCSNDDQCDPGYECKSGSCSIKEGTARIERTAWSDFVNWIKDLYENIKVVLLWIAIIALIFFLGRQFMPIIGRFLPVMLMGNPWILGVIAGIIILLIIYAVLKGSVWWI